MLRRSDRRQVRSLDWVNQIQVSPTLCRTIYTVALITIAAVILISSTCSMVTATGALEGDAPSERQLASTPSRPLLVSSSGSPDSGTLSTPTMMINVHEREFNSPQVRVQMDCQRDKSIVKLTFMQSFNGILGTGKLDTTECKLRGNGTRYYELLVPHNSTKCGTSWDAGQSSIFNTLFIRFHSTLETGADLAKTLMCRLTVGDLVVGRRPSKKPKSERLSASSFRPQKRSTTAPPGSASTSGNIQI